MECYFRTSLSVIREGLRVYDESIMTAVHEAGHIVLAYSFGVDALIVTLEGEQDYTGRTYFERKLEDIESRICVLLAGTLSEYPESTADSFRRIKSVFQGDGLAIERDAKASFGRGWVARVDPLIPRTREILHREWGAVETLATKLLHRITLDRGEIAWLLGGRSTGMEG